MPIEIGREHTLAIRARRLVIHCAESGAMPRRGVAFDDERAAIGRIAIMMSNERTMLILAKSERQTFERLGRPVPDELVREPLDAWTEDFCVCTAHDRMDAIRAHDEIAVSEGIGVQKPSLEGERHPSS